MRPSAARALAGALALAAAMGIGRFAYTALLPAAQAALGFDDAAGGAIASANLVGYLVGVLAARGITRGATRARALRAGIALTALSTVLLVASGSTVAWSALRLAAGIASGLVFVLASAAALEVPSGEHPHPGVLYSGVGIGIALAGLVAAVLAGADWRAAWGVLGVMAAVLGGPAWIVLTRSSPSPLPSGDAASGRRRRRLFSPPLPTPSVGSGPSRGEGDRKEPAAKVAAPPFSLARLGAAYLLEGLGYIVSGTFAVVAVRRTPGLEALAPWTWTLTGLAAAPSALLWSAIGRRIGLRAALVLAHGVQAVGMSLPSLSPSAAAAITGAILFGNTFIGIVTLAMSAARALAPHAFARAVATLTALYGVGQIAGPLAAGALSRRLGDPRPGVLGAAGAVALGGLLLAWPSRRPRA
jgi:MFS family permease